MDGQADSERYMNMTAGGSPGMSGEYRAGQATFSARTSGPMVPSPAWPDLNGGYKNGWPASVISRRPSRICSQQAIKS